MLDDTVPTTTTADEPIVQETPSEPPPAGDGEKSEKYLNQLIDLINQDKLPVSHTDLNKFNITSIEDHYRMDLGEYEVEINHSKQPDTGQDFYVMLFNNIKKIEGQEQSCMNKIILAYTHLTQPQFEDFKEAADAAIERKRKKEEEKRFTSAMSPIDNLLNTLSSNSPEETKEESKESMEATPTESDSDDSNDQEEQTEDLADFDDSTDNSPKASDFLSQPPTTY